MQIIMMCDYMKWTYLDYIDQPNWFIELLSEKMNEDARHQNQSQKKYGRKRS